MINKLDYVPSWVKGARTLLEKLDLCIAKIEEVDETHATKDELEEISNIFTNTISQLRTEILEKFDANSLVEIFEGSDTVVVDVNEAGTKIEIHLDSDIVSKIERSILLPIGALGQECVPVVAPNKSVTYIPVDNVGGPKKVYYQKVFHGNRGEIIVSPPIEEANIISYNNAPNIEAKEQAMLQYVNGIIYTAEYDFPMSIVTYVGIQTQDEDSWLNVSLANDRFLSDVRGTEQINTL